LRSETVETLAEDHDGNLWIGTRGGGLAGWPTTHRLALARRRALDDTVL
jgi:ligand-binding sensor domain-containing protein